MNGKKLLKYRIPYNGLVQVVRQVKGLEDKPRTEIFRDEHMPDVIAAMTTNALANHLQQINAIITKARRRDTSSKILLSAFLTIGNNKVVPPEEIPADIQPIPEKASRELTRGIYNLAKLLASGEKTKDEALSEWTEIVKRAIGEHPLAGFITDLGHDTLNLIAALDRSSEWVDMRLRVAEITSPQTGERTISVYPYFAQEAIKVALGIADIDNEILENLEKLGALGAALEFYHNNFIQPGGSNLISRAISVGKINDLLQLFASQGTLLNYVQYWTLKEPGVKDVVWQKLREEYSLQTDPPPPEGVIYAYITSPSNSVMATPKGIRSSPAPALRFYQRISTALGLPTIKGNTATFERNLVPNIASLLELALDVVNYLIQRLKNDPSETVEAAFRNIDERARKAIFELVQRFNKAGETLKGQGFEEPAPSTPPTEEIEEVLPLKKQEEVTEETVPSIFPPKSEVIRNLEALRSRLESLLAWWQKASVQRKLEEFVPTTQLLALILGAESIASPHFDDALSTFLHALTSIAILDEAKPRSLGENIYQRMKTLINSMRGAPFAQKAGLYGPLADIGHLLFVITADDLRRHDIEEAKERIKNLLETIRRAEPYKQGKGGKDVYLFNLNIRSWASIVEELEKKVEKATTHDELYEVIKELKEYMWRAYAGAFAGEIREGQEIKTVQGVNDAVATSFANHIRRLLAHEEIFPQVLRQLSSLRSSLTVTPATFVSEHPREEEEGEAPSIIIADVQATPEEVSLSTWDAIVDAIITTATTTKNPEEARERLQHIHNTIKTFVESGELDEEDYEEFLDKLAEITERMKEPAKSRIEQIFLQAEEVEETIPPERPTKEEAQPTLPEKTPQQPPEEEPEEFVDVEEEDIEEEDILRKAIVWALFLRVVS